MIRSVRTLLLRALLVALSVVLMLVHTAERVLVAAMRRCRHASTQRHVESALHGRAYREVERASERIGTLLRRTPVEWSPWLSGMLGRSGTVHLKLESEQVTGSFKARGALNKVLSLSADELAHGITTSSTGNHALAVTHALTLLPNGVGREIEAAIVLPNNASLAKVEALQDRGAPLQFHGDDCVQAETFARRLAEREGCCYISPYNDMQVLGGQGTIAVELLEDLPELDAVFVPLGGGGLLSGIVAYIKAVKPSVTVVGCSPAENACMVKSISAGRILAEDEFGNADTLSEGTMGGIEDNSVTYELCRNLVDDYCLVSEDEIAQSMADVMDKHHKAIEGAAATAVASFRKMSKQYMGKHVAIVICGGNIRADTMRDVLNSHLHDSASTALESGDTTTEDADNKAV